MRYYLFRAYTKGKDNRDPSGIGTWDKALFLEDLGKVLDTADFITIIVEETEK